jgi:hypothetical protein
MCFKNRRVRNRTHGGVGGRGRRLPLLPDHPANSTCGLDFCPEGLHITAPIATLREVPPWGYNANKKPVLTRGCIADAPLFKPAVTYCAEFNITPSRS